MGGIIVLIDNKPRGSREDYSLRRVLMEDLHEKLRVVHYQESNLESIVLGSGVKAVITGGSPALITTPEVRRDYAKEIQVLCKVDKPLLGICHGHQLIALAYGGLISLLKEKVIGYHPIEIVKKDPLFEGLGNHLNVWEAHREAVSALPEGFSLLARSEKCEVEAVRLEGKIVYGVQFHPEKYNEYHPEGLMVLKNFLKIVNDK